MISFISFNPNGLFQNFHTFGLFSIGSDDTIRGYVFIVKFYINLKKFPSD